MQLKSNYWKVNGNENDALNDTNQYYLPSNTSLAKCQNTIAVGSNTQYENLKIYELTSSNSLVHMSSISLADIQCLQFLAPIDDASQDFRFLVSGHSEGIAHLSTVPTSVDSSLESAEIIKRFNHRRFLMNDAFDCSPILNTGNHASTISSIELSPSSWMSSPLNSLITVYNHNVFLWDSCRSRNPKSVLSTVGVSNLSANPHLDGVVGIVGEFGLSLLDFRSGELSPFLNSNNASPFNQSSNRASVSHSFQSKRISSSSTVSSRCSAPSPIKNYCSFPLTNVHNFKSRATGATGISWHKNGYLLSTSNISDHKDSVQIWDIRKLEPLAVLEGSQEEVVQLKWLDDILWTADKDGYVYKWDTTSVKTGINSSKNLDCCQSFHVANSKIVGMEVSKDAENNQVICLDSKFLGMHCDSDNSSSNVKENSYAAKINPHLPKVNKDSLSFDYSLKLQKDIDHMMSGLNYFVKDSGIYL